MRNLTIYCFLCLTLPVLECCAFHSCRGVSSRYPTPEELLSAANTLAVSSADDAKQCLKICVERGNDSQPGLFDCILALARHESQAGSHVSAAMLYERALSIKPAYTSLHAQSGAEFLLSGSRLAHKALYHCQAAVKASPRNDAYASDLALALYYTQDVLGALRQWKQAIKLNPRKESAYLY